MAIRVNQRQAEFYRQQRPKVTGSVKCNCYVRELSEYDKFVTRYGAHSLDCPVYRESGDIVDRKYDENFRLRHG